jgi:CRISPR-associated protein Csd2
MATDAKPIDHRYDFVLLFDVTNGNPNGDPDTGNAPRIDPETGHGLVSDVCLKRKIRNYVALAKVDPETKQPAPGYDIYVKHQGILNLEHQKAHDAVGLTKDVKEKGKRIEAQARARAWMCQTFYDVRTFGAVMSTDINCGQVRGPVQIAFARSQDPIASLEQSITRKAVTTEREAKSQVEKHGQITGTMGRKEIIPYALYEVHGFVSPHLAADTGFSDEDLALLWDALKALFEHDRSATRGEMASRKLVVFEHESLLGNAPAHALFERISVERNDTSKPARAFGEYTVMVDTENLPTGVTAHEML